MLQENIGLIFHKREELQIPYSHFLVTNNLVEHGCLSSKTTCYLAPLFLNSAHNEKKGNRISQILLFEPEIEYGTKQANIKHELLEELKTNFKKFAKPDVIFYYIYAVLYSNTYRKKYAEFLKIDFPRIPFTKDYKLFIQLGKLGKQLADLHLLKSKELDKIISKFPKVGSSKLEKLKYDDEKVWINKDQYFENVKEEVWNYQIGGYQVCEKWLKDRKGRALSSEEIKTYCKIVTALSKTIELQKEIDKLYTDVEKSI